jgi:hypothetical protein
VIDRIEGAAAPARKQALIRLDVRFVAGRAVKAHSGVRTDVVGELRIAFGPLDDFAELWGARIPGGMRTAPRRGPFCCYLRPLESPSAFLRRA